ncbi:hypothetical protein QL285_038077 [Trifolium repens]|nr:hypothetical protein QL285_038077 [Trifolium repens]
MAAMTATEAEAWSLLKGLQWIASYNYQHVIIELDCQQVVNDVYTNKSNCSEYGLIVQNYKTFLKNHNNYKVVFTRRKANESAHTLARAVLSHASRTTFDVIPSCIAPIIINEMV